MANKNLREKNTVKQGRSIVQLPVILIILIIPLIIWMLFSLQYFDLWIVTFSVVTTLLIASGLYTILLATRRNWAYQQLHHLQPLKKHVAAMGLPFHQFNFFEHTEIHATRSSPFDSSFINKKNIDYSLNKAMDLPTSTYIMTTPYYLYAQLLACIVALVLTTIALLTLPSIPIKMLAVACFITIIAITYNLRGNFISRKPKITLSDHGITTTITGFIPWRDIFYEQIISKEVDQKRKKYLYFYWDTQDISICIDRVSYSPKQIALLLKAYRMRSSLVRQN